MWWALVKCVLWASALACQVIIILAFAVAGAEAVVEPKDLTRNQAARDVLFKNLKTPASHYSFEYFVIYIPAGSIPGVDTTVPVSHVRFKSTIFFAFDKADLEPSSAEPIADLAKVVLTDRSAKSVLVVGHTDAVGPDQYNSNLSMKRAVAVATKLREAGVSEKLLGVVPMGEAQPVATNRTSLGRSQNRRVEFFISDLPQATRKAIELVKFDPCHRNDQDVAADQPNPACNNTDSRIPVFPGTTGRGQPEMLVLGRDVLSVSAPPTKRIPLPIEVLERPSLRDLQLN